MHIGIIDCDLLAKGNHRFPNLACMKISSYYKNCDHDVDLVKSWEEDLYVYDKLLVSKVFTSTQIPVIKHDNIKYGGTGFYFDKAEPLPDRIEHIKPDYTLYYDYIKQFPYSKKLRKSFEMYIDYSIGFLTRGCFRKCKFCVNQNCDMVREHSPLKEFYDEDRKKICLLDDNFLACSNWRQLLAELQDTGKPFVFKQGLDERLLTKEKCDMLFSSRYDRDFIFAFDNIADREVIEEKLKIIRSCTNKNVKFYVLVGFDRNNKYDMQFWRQDVIDMFERIKILMRYKCLPYIMRFENYQLSPYRGTYITVARWCNQVSFFKRKSFNEFVEANVECSNNVNCSTKRYYDKVIKDIPELREYFEMKWID